VNLLYLIAALPAAVALGVWAAADLQRFVLWFVLPAMIVPAALVRPGGTQVALADILLLVALALWLILRTAGRVPRMRLSGNPILLPAVLFVSVAADSIAWSVNQGATVKFTIQLVELIIVFPVIFSSIPQSLRAIRRGFLAYIGVSSVLAVIMVIVYAPHAAAGDLAGQSLALGLGKNTVGSVVGAGLVLAYSLWAAERRGRVRRRLAVAALIDAAGLFSTVSRAAIIGTLVALVVVSLLQRRARVQTLTLIAVSTAAYLAVIGISSHAQTNAPGSYDSSTLRSYAWADAVRKIEARPLLGTGGATYTDDIVQIHAIVSDPNNMFLLTWAELGIAGMLTLCFLLFRFARLLLENRRLPGEFATLATAAGGVSLSVLVHVQFDETWIRGSSSLAFSMMGLMVALRRMARVAAAERHAPGATPARDERWVQMPRGARPEIA
jgi:O-antigen ligase